MAALLTAHLAADAAARRRAWGEAAPVVVLRREVEAGSVVTEDALGVQDVPLALVPEGAVEAPAGGGAPPAAGRVASADLVVGEVLVRDRLAPEAFAVDLGAGPSGRAVAVPLQVPAPGLEAGDRVELLAPILSSAAGAGPVVDVTGGAGAPGGAGGAAVEVVARDAVVLEVDESTLVVAVRGDEVAAVVAGLVHGTVVPVRRPA